MEEWAERIDSDPAVDPFHAGAVYDSRPENDIGESFLLTIFDDQFVLHDLGVGIGLPFPFRWIFHRAGFVQQGARLHPDVAVDGKGADIDEPEQSSAARAASMRFLVVTTELR